MATIGTMTGSANRLRLRLSASLMRMRRASGAGRRGVAGMNDQDDGDRVSAAGEAM